MIRLSEIVSSFRTLVGWDGVDELDKSDSGLYFQEAHPLLTVRAMRGIMPKDMYERYPSYESGRFYDLGDRVKYNGKAYESLKASNNENISSGYWKEVDLLKDYLLSLTDRGIKKAVNRFIQDKMVGLESKSIIDRRTLFDGMGRKEARVESKGRLVGFEITPLRANGVTTILNKVGLQFVGNVGTVKLYLFHSSQSEPIATKEVEYDSERGSYLWFDLDWTLPYVNDSINAGGSWFVVYNQDELPSYMEAVNFGRDWSREPCGTCNKGDAVLYRMMTRHASFSPFYVVADGWDGNLWDIDDMVYSNTNNYGINFMFSMVCDLTDTLIDMRSEFASVVQLQVAEEALRSLALNAEVAVNRVQSNANMNDILFELQGNGEGIRGLRGDLERAYKALSVDTKGLDQVCLTCHNRGIRYSSI